MEPRASDRALQMMCQTRESDFYLLVCMTSPLHKQYSQNTPPDFGGGDETNIRVIPNRD